MKVILTATILLFSTLSFADDSARIKSLEDRIRALEAQNGSTADSGGLKVKDLGGQKIESNRSPASRSNAPALSPAKQAEIMKQLEGFKARRQEEVQLLEQMDEEGY